MAQSGTMEFVGFIILVVVGSLFVANRVFGPRSRPKLHNLVVVAIAAVLIAVAVAVLLSRFS